MLTSCGSTPHTGARTGSRSTAAVQLGGLTPIGSALHWVEDNPAPHLGPAGAPPVVLTSEGSTPSIPPGVQQRSLQKHGAPPTLLELRAGPSRRRQRLRHRDVRGLIHHNLFCSRSHCQENEASGCSAAVARLVWDQDVAGSIPAAPTKLVVYEKAPGLRPRRRAELGDARAR